ncbi:MAG: ABC transporter ATP-binding protein [Candidatus Nanopelagicales bacterium]
MSAGAATAGGRPGGAGGAGGPGGHGPRPGGGGGGPMGGLFVQAQKSTDFAGTVRRLTERLRPQAAWIAAVITMTVGSVILAVVGPKLLGNATTLVFEGFISSQLPAGVPVSDVIADLVAQGQDDQAAMLGAMDIVPGSGVDFTSLGRLLTLVAVLYLISSLLSWASAYIMAGVTQATIYDLREEVDRKIGRLPLKYFDSHARGDLLSRVTNDIDNISTTLQQVLTSLITAVLTVVGVLGIMFWMSPMLALISLLTVPLSFVVTMAIAKRSQKQFAAQWEWTGELNGHVEQMYTGHDLVKVFGHSARAVEEFDELNDKMYAASFRAQFISGIIQPAMTLISNLNYVLISVVGGLQVASGAMPLGDVQAFIQYARQFQMPITQIASVVNLMQSGVASAERVFEFLDAQDEIADPADPQRPQPVRGRVEFDDVSFQYVPDKPLIEGLNLVVEVGESCAIVGPTGAGKTTLVNLLMRFYDVDSGRITLDGVDVMTMTRDDLRGSFGMVLQDTWLFGGTIRDNIAYGAQDATDEQVLAAADAAYVDHFVRTLPDGYDTVLDDEATNVSTGEKQLITIARAFLSDPAILILDEATSSVDTRTEVLVQKAMANLRHGRTSFIIAHRLSTIRDADTILVMESGAIVEKGSHTDLIEREGAYARLYQSQFAGALEG